MTRLKLFYLLYILGGSFFFFFFFFFLVFQVLFLNFKWKISSVQTSAKYTHILFFFFSFSGSVIYMKSGFILEYFSGSTKQCGLYNHLLPPYFTHRVSHQKLNSSLLNISLLSLRCQVLYSSTCIMGVPGISIYHIGESLPKLEDCVGFVFFRIQINLAHDYLQR